MKTIVKDDDGEKSVFVNMTAFIELVTGPFEYSFLQCFEFFWVA